MIDLSVEVKGVKFRNPIIPGSAELLLDEKDVAKCIKHGVGGIVTKSFSSEPFTWARPFFFNYRGFGQGLEDTWGTDGGSHPLTSEEGAEKVVPKMARLCRDEAIPLIVSMRSGGDINQWVSDARMFEEAGADMLEFSFSSLRSGQPIGTAADKALGQLEQDIDFTIEIIRAVKKAVKIPISPKIRVGFEPAVKGWAEAGADCITCSNPPAAAIIDVEQEVPFGGLGISGYSLGRVFLPINLRKVLNAKILTDVPIFASGGVFQATDAIMYLLLGCPVVEVCSAVYKYGYRIFGEIIKGIEEWMEHKGYSSIDDFIGKAYELAALPGTSDMIYMETPFSPEEESSPIIPEIDVDKCNLCGRCQDFCLSEVFIVDGAKGVVNVDYENKCWGCGHCVGLCPVDAIRLIDRDTGEVVWDNRGLARPYRPENWRR